MRRVASKEVSAGRGAGEWARKKDVGPDSHVRTPFVPPGTVRVPIGLNKQRVGPKESSGSQVPRRLPPFAAGASTACPLPPYPACARRLLRAGHVKPSAGHRGTGPRHGSSPRGP